MRPEEKVAIATDLQKAYMKIKPGLANVYLESSFLIGGLARVSGTLRGIEDIENEKKLLAMGLALGVEVDTLKGRILPSLEELGWVTIKWKKDRFGGKIQRLEDFIPSMPRVFRDLANYWEEQNPSDMDHSYLNLMKETSKYPITQSKALEISEDLNEKDYDLLLEFCKKPKLIDTFKSKKLNENILVAPYYWGDNWTILKDRISEYSDKDFHNLRTVTTNLFSEGLGIPDYHLDAEILKNRALGVLVRAGAIQKVKIEIPRRKKEFYFFPPYPSLKTHLSSEITGHWDILDKAKHILSCVKHGMYRAQGTTIKLPIALLKALRDKENGLNPHGYTKRQYTTLIQHNIVKSEANRIKLVKTEENKQAIDVAIEMLQEKQPLTPRVVDSEARALLIKGSFLPPPALRPTIDLSEESEIELKRAVEITTGEDY